MTKSNQEINLTDLNDRVEEGLAALKKMNRMLKLRYVLMALFTLLCAVGALGLAWRQGAAQGQDHRAVQALGQQVDSLQVVIREAPASAWVNVKVDEEPFRAACEYKVVVTDQGFAPGTQFMPTYVSPTQLVAYGQQHRMLKVNADRKNVAAWINFEPEPATSQEVQVSLWCRCQNAQQP